MNELLKIEISEKQEQVISGRALHMFLDIETPYTMWFERMLQYGFCNGKDFLTKMLESHGGRPSTDHIISWIWPKSFVCSLETKRVSRPGNIF